MHFSPAASGLTASTVQVEGLEPYANYTFTIKSQNRVSGLDSSSPSSASLSINMGQAGEAPQTTGMGDGQEAAEVQLKSFLLIFPIQRCHSGCPESLSGLSLKLVKKEPRQLELTWAGSRLQNPGGNLSYELHVLNQVRKHLGDTIQGLGYIPHLGYRMGRNSQSKLFQDRERICEGP